MLHRRSFVAWALAAAFAVLAGLSGPAPAVAQDPARVGVVSHVKVLSDKVEDVSSPEAWKRSYIRDGMSDQEKVLAIWRTVVKYRHQTNPPNEWIQDNVHDVFKTIHVYGYGMCCCAASHVETLARYLGLPARGWGITAHSVPEVFYDGSWHLVDGSLMNYFLNPDGKIASVADVKKAVMDWHAQHPGYRASDGKLRQFAASGGWKKGPALLASTGERFWDANGINAAGWHGWPSTMQEYDCKEFLFDYGGSMGYELNVQLRAGERLTRNWSNKGLHVNMLEGEDQSILKDCSPLGMCRKLGDVAPGRIGNGTLEYDVPLAGGEFRLGALEAENLVSRSEDKALPAAVCAKDPARPGVLVLEMPSSYVYLSGEASLKAVVGRGGAIAVSFSDNHGLDFREIARLTGSGECTVDLKPFIFRRYDYRLSFRLEGKGTGLDTLTISHDIQHSQAPLPALAEGSNTITCSAGAAEGTITLEGCLNPDAARAAKQISHTDYHPVLAGLAANMLRVGDSGKGEATYAIATPGDLVRIRMNAHYRARDARDGFEVQVSYDDGKTFRKAQDLAGPTVASSRYFTIADVPQGVRRALVRLLGRQRNTACIFDLRMDADYAEPHGGIAPVKITYVWEEDGKERRHVHVASGQEETYKIQCGGGVVMKSLIVER